MKNSLSYITKRISLFSWITSFDESDAIKSSQLFKGSAGIFVLQVLSVGLTFFISLLFARFLGAKGYGMYAYSLAWVSFLFVPSVLGFDQLLIRDISVYKIRSEWSLMRGLIRFSHQLVFLSSLIFVAIAVFIRISLGNSSDSTFMYTFCLALILLPLSVLIMIKRSILIGLQKVVLGHAPETLIKPSILLVGVALIYFLGFKEILSPIAAIIITILASLISLCVIFFILKRELPRQIYNTVPVYDLKLWIKSALPLLLIGGMLVINFQVDIIMLGAIKGPVSAGIYSIASSCAGLVAFVLISVNAALAPVIASLYAEGNMMQLQRQVTLSARLIILFSLPIAIILILFGKVFLSFFGAEFVFGLSSLRILCIGQIINVSAGSVGLLLNMTGHERISAMGFGIGAMSNIVLNAVLIPILGMVGAAIGSAISMVLWNILLAIKVHKHTGIHSTAFGQLSLGVKIK